MTLTDLSVRRPVLATVMSMVLVIFGAFAFDQLTVREYPDIDKPVISINTTYRGASARVVETRVTQILEDSISGIAGIDTINSTSREESSSISIEFSNTRDIDSAANDVRDRVSRAISNLPDDSGIPQVAKADSDARAIIWVVLTSDRMNQLELTDYAERYLIDSFSTVSGVASVRVGAGRRYAMRIWLDVSAMAARGITAQDVESALSNQHVEIPSGRIESINREISVRTDSALRTPEEFRNVVIKRGSRGYLVRLGEIADVALGPQDVRSELRANGESAIGLGIVKQSKANTLDVADGVANQVSRLKPTLPQSMNLDVSYDQSIFVRQSIKEVFIALSIALVLVVGVIFIFLRSLSATLIPAIVIPVSVVASFIVLAALGYSINVLTLLAYVLAIGLVVDDAIVVLENIHRRIENGEPPLLAAVRGGRQITFAVVATTAVLVAVFVPISFMEGNTGRLFREFGVAVAVAVIMSSAVALSLVPMLSARLLPAKGQSVGLYRLTEPGFAVMHRIYRWILMRCLNVPLVILAVGLGISGIAYELMRELPREFVPVEDRGMIFIPVSAPEGASLEYTRRYVLDIEKALLPLRDRGDAERIFTILAPSFGRPGQVNSAFSAVRLTDWSDRKLSQQQIVAEIAPKLAAVPGVRAFPINPASLGQRSFSAPIQMVLGGPTYEKLAEWSNRIVERIRADNPNLLNVNADYTETRPELKVTIYRDRASELGISIEEVGRTLEMLLGARFVTTFIHGGKEYNVIIQSRAEDRETPQDLHRIYVRSQTSGELIALSNLINFEAVASASELKRVDRLRAITISASLAPGYPMGDAVAFLDQVASEVMPHEARVSYKGESREYKRSSTSIYTTFGLALLIVFLVLAAQFESFIHPLIIMLVVPLAVTGAFGAMMLSDLSINIYTQIGIIMLIGLIAKNSILIVEFANQLRDRGESIHAAISAAALARLRPILMTTIATAFGAMPLAFSSGAGSEARVSLGIVIIGGVGFATLLSLFVVPVLYSVLARFTHPSGRIARRLSALELEHTTSVVTPVTD